MASGHPLGLLPFAAVFYALLEAPSLPPPTQGRCMQSSLRLAGASAGCAGLLKMFPLRLARSCQTPSARANALCADRNQRQVPRPCAVSHVYSRHHPAGTWLLASRTRLLDAASMAANAQAHCPAVPTTASSRRPRKRAPAWYGAHRLRLVALCERGITLLFRFIMCARRPASS